MPGLAQAYRDSRLQGRRDRMELDVEDLEPWALRAVADAALERTASQLRDTLKSLAGRRWPFPNFLGMTTIQALEVQPEGFHASNRGCVVVGPDGELYEMSLLTIPGPVGISDVDHVEEMKPLELPQEEYVPYAAIVALTAILEAQRGGPP